MADPYTIVGGDCGDVGDDGRRAGDSCGSEGDNSSLLSTTLFTFLARTFKTCGDKLLSPVAHTVSGGDPRCGKTAAGDGRDLRKCRRRRAHCRRRRGGVAQVSKALPTI